MNIPHIGANYLALTDFTHQQGIKLEFIKNLPQRGLYEHQQRRIQLMDGMTQPRMISTLAHELGHAYYGDETTSQHIEQRAWQYAAKLLLTHEQVKEATLAYEHPILIAHELGVTTEVIEAWRQAHATHTPQEH